MGDKSSKIKDFLPIYSSYLFLLIIFLIFYPRRGEHANTRIGLLSRDVGPAEGHVLAFDAFMGSATAARKYEPVNRCM